MRAVDLGRWIAGGAAGVTIAVGPSAHADPPCALVVVPDALAPRWTSAIDELKSQIARLPASECRSMTLSIERSGDALRVVATTADGRRTERAVSGPESLAATALGLVLTIPAQTPAPPPDTPPRDVAPVPSPPPAPVPREMAPPAVAPASHPLAMWAGLAAGLRLTAPTAVTVLDVEARLDVLLGRWLVLSTLRSALVSCLPGQGLDCDVYNDVSFGVGVGRRVRTGSATVDLGLEPSVVWMHMEYDGASEAQDVAGDEVALRVDASARLAVSLSERWALTVTVDAGLAPAMLETHRLESPASFGDLSPPPPFPAWTGGVRIGASGAVL